MSALLVPSYRDCTGAGNLEATRVRAQELGWEQELESGYIEWARRNFDRAVAVAVKRLLDVHILMLFPP